MYVIESFLNFGEGKTDVQIRSKAAKALGLKKDHGFIYFWYMKGKQGIYNMSTKFTSNKTLLSYSSNSN